MLTIGQLAKRVNLRTSTLRYYEQEGLLVPAGRTGAGYRLYEPAAERTLRFIQRAQRLGLSLADIRTLLTKYQADQLSDETIIETVEARALALERDLTHLLVLRHELNLFLQDLRHESGAPPPAEHTGADHFDRLLERICANPQTQSATNVLDWLIEYAGCRLNSTQGQALIRQLRGQHVHVWQEDDAYHILVVSRDARIGSALESLARLEATCQASPAVAEVRHDDAEGYHFIARGAHAFIYARLFLALEQEAE